MIEKGSRTLTTAMQESLKFNLRFVKKNVPVTQGPVLVLHGPMAAYLSIFLFVCKGINVGI